MKERPIIFSALMLRAILAGAKTQTRRVVSKQFAPDAMVAEVAAMTPEGWQISGHSGLWWDDAGACIDDAVRCPYGLPGDRLFVREAFRLCQEADEVSPRDSDPGYRVWYEADKPHQPGAGRLRPSIHMPRWASRITLEVTSVRVERLHDISRGDAMAEGCPYPNMAYGTSPTQWFKDEWIDAHGPSGWESNPWVWVVEFRQV